MGVECSRPVSRLIHWLLGEFASCLILLLFSARILQANGKRNGFGVLKLSNGDVFEGIWANDVRSGFGMMKFASGEEYKGGWEDNKFHGSAICSAYVIVCDPITKCTGAGSDCRVCRQRHFETRQRRYFLRGVSRWPCPR